MKRRSLSIATLFLTLAAFAAATHAAQSIVLTAGPSQGAAPFEADLRVIATGPDEDTKLDCELLFGDVQNGEPAGMRFVLESPWPAEAVFPHTYRYAGTFSPDITCVGGGTTGDTAEVVVGSRAANRPPQLELSVSPASARATVTRTLTVGGIADPDGDTLDCFVDLDVNSDFNFSGDDTVIPFSVAPPYADVEFQYKWDVARGYTPNVFCVDGQGGSVARSAQVSVNPVSGNRAPSVQLDRQFPYNSEPGVNRRFRVRMDDPDNETLRCQFRATWDSPREYFTAPPPYGAKSFYATFKRMGNHLQAYALCVDPRGAMTSINRGFEVETFPAGNGFPVILGTHASPEVGEVPPGLDVEIAINAFDPDGDALTCEIDYGPGQGSDVLSIPAARQGVPVASGHMYDARGSHNSRIVCEDGGLADAPAYEWVHVHESGKRFPTVSIDADPDNGGGLLPVTLSLEFDDPDGDTLDCRFSYGETYAGGGVLPDDVEFQVAPPYDPVVLETTYRGTHRSELSCLDPSGRRHDTESWIRVSPFNQAPAVENFRPHQSSSIKQSLFVIFPVGVSDPNLDERIDCELDFGDGVVWPFLRFQFPDYQILSVSHLYPARDEPYEAVLSCDDNEGATVEARQTIEVGASANRAPEVDAVPRPAYGYAPFDTTFRVSVEDVNAFEGDVATCTIDFDDGSAPVVIPQGAQIDIPHRYSLPTVYHPTITCTDTFGATTTITRTVVGTLPGAGSRVPPVTISR